MITLKNKDMKKLEIKFRQYYTSEVLIESSIILPFMYFERPP